MNFPLPAIVVFYISSLLTLFIAPNLIPYLGFFPYVEEIYRFHLPETLEPLGFFDGVHYLIIASRGYQQYQQAFFPLYPLLIRFVSRLTSLNFFTSALLISNFSFLLAIRFLYSYLKLIKIRFPFWTILFLLAFPTSFYFHAVYTESLFFLLVVLSLYFLSQKKYLPLFVFSFLASLTRLAGIFLLIPILHHLLFQSFKSARRFLTVLAPILGVSLYSLYLYQTTGDPLFFFHAVPHFSTGRSTSLVLFPRVIYRYLKIFFTAASNFQYFVAFFEFSFFLLFFIILSLQLYRLFQKRAFSSPLFSLNLFSFANLLLPTFTGTFTSLPRYLLSSLSAFIFFSQIKSPIIKYSLFTVFLLLHFLTFAFFIQGYFIS